MATAVGSAGVVADQLTVTDPGQLGDAAAVHEPGGNLNPRNATSPPADPAPPVLSVGRRWALPQFVPGGSAPFLLAPDEHEAFDNGDPNSPQIYGGAHQDPLQGAPAADTIVVEEHGPRERTTLRAGFWGWWPFGRRAAYDERPENVATPLGGDEYVADPRPAYSSVNRDNMVQVPDVRRVFAPLDAPLYEGRAGSAITPVTQEPMAYEVHSEQDDPDVVFYVSNEDERPRAGAAHPWEARPARNPFTWWFQRPFDQAIAHHTPGLKGVMGAPKVSLPYMSQQEVETTGVAGYHVSTPAPGMEPIGVIPNTWRVTPQPWDQDLVTTGVSSSPVVSGQIGIQQSAASTARWRL